MRTHTCSLVRLLGIFVLLLSLVAFPSASNAAFLGRNGKIAFESIRGDNYDIDVMNPDGSGQMDLTKNPAISSLAGGNTNLKQSGCAPPSWLVDSVSRSDSTEGPFGSVDFNSQLSDPRTFEGRLRARAADNSGLGIIVCIIQGDCGLNNLLDWLLQILDWVSFSKGELSTGMDLRLDGQPGAEAQIEVQGNLDGLLAVSSFILGRSTAKVTADLLARPGGGVERVVLRELREDESTLDQGAYFTPISKTGSEQMTLITGDQLHLGGYLRAESRSENLILGVAVGASQFFDAVSGGYFDQLSPPIDIPNPGLKVKVTILNVSPILAAHQPTVAVDEGQVASNSGTLCDGDSDPVMLTASVGTVVNNHDGTWTWTYPPSDGPANQAVTITANDAKGGTDQISFNLFVSNAGPTVNAGPDQTVFRYDPVTLSGTWTDPAGPQDEPYLWSWDLTADGVPDTAGSAPYGGAIAATAMFVTEGQYALAFQVSDHDGAAGADSLFVDVLNRPPNCSRAAAVPDRIWPANHKFMTVQVTGITDPEGDAVSITIDSIFQDEAVNAPGSGNTSPDGQGVGTSTAQVRAERMGSGDGRVYHIQFKANDGRGGLCTGEVKVSVPKSEKSTPVDGGPLHDSNKVVVGAADAVQDSEVDEDAGSVIYLPLITQ